MASNPSRLRPGLTAWTTLTVLLFAAVGAQDPTSDGETVDRIDMLITVGIVLGVFAGTLVLAGCLVVLCKSRRCQSLPCLDPVGAFFEAGRRQKRTTSRRSRSHPRPNGRSKRRRRKHSSSRSRSSQSRSRSTTAGGARGSGGADASHRSSSHKHAKTVRVKRSETLSDISDHISIHDSLPRNFKARHSTRRSPPRSSDPAPAKRPMSPHPERTSRKGGLARKRASSTTAKRHDNGPPDFDLRDFAGTVGRIRKHHRRKDSDVMSDVGIRIRRRPEEILRAARASRASKPSRITAHRGPNRHRQENLRPDRSAEDIRSSPGSSFPPAPHTSPRHARSLAPPYGHVSEHVHASGRTPKDANRQKKRHIYHHKFNHTRSRRSSQHGDSIDSHGRAVSRSPSAAPIAASPVGYDSDPGFGARRFQSASMQFGVVNPSMSSPTRHSYTPGRSGSGHSGESDDESTKSPNDSMVSSAVSSRHFRLDSTQYRGQEAGYPTMPSLRLADASRAAAFSGGDGRQSPISVRIQLQRQSDTEGYRSQSSPLGGPVRPPGDLGGFEYATPPATRPRTLSPLSSALRKDIIRYQQEGVQLLRRESAERKIIRAHDSRLSKYNSLPQPLNGGPASNRIQGLARDSSSPIGPQEYGPKATDRGLPTRQRSFSERPPSRAPIVASAVAPSLPLPPPSPAYLARFVSAQQGIPSPVVLQHSHPRDEQRWRLSAEGRSSGGGTHRSANGNSEPELTNLVRARRSIHTHGQDMSQQRQHQQQRSGPATGSAQHGPSLTHSSSSEMSAQRRSPSPGPGSQQLRSAQKGFSSLHGSMGADMLHVGDHLPPRSPARSPGSSISLSRDGRGLGVPFPPIGPQSRDFRSRSGSLSNGSNLGDPPPAGLAGHSHNQRPSPLPSSTPPPPPGFSRATSTPPSTSFTSHHYVPLLPNLTASHRQGPPDPSFYQEPSTLPHGSAPNRPLYRAPTFQEHPTSSHNELGASIVLRASADGWPLPTISWQHNGRPMSPPRHGSHLSLLGHRHESGVYTCVASQSDYGVAVLSNRATVQFG